MGEGKIGNKSEVNLWSSGGESEGYIHWRQGGCISVHKTVLGYDVPCF